MENESGLDLKIVNVYSLKFPSKLKNSKENECSESYDAKSIPLGDIIISADKTALQSGKTRDFPQDDANVNIVNLVSSPASEDISSKQSIIASKESRTFCKKSIGGIKDSNTDDNKRLEMTRQHQAVPNLYDTIKERRKSALKARCDPSLKLQKKRKVSSESDDEEPRCRKIKSPLDKRDQLRELGCLVVLEDVEEDLAGRTKIMCRHWVRRCEKCKRSCRQKYVNALYRKSAKQLKSGEEGIAQNGLCSNTKIDMENRSLSSTDRNIDDKFDPSIHDGIKLLQATFSKNTDRKFSDKMQGVAGREENSTFSPDKTEEKLAEKQCIEGKMGGFKSRTEDIISKDKNSSDKRLDEDLSQSLTASSACVPKSAALQPILPKADNATSNIPTTNANDPSNHLQSPESPSTSASDVPSTVQSGPFLLASLNGSVVLVPVKSDGTEGNVPFQNAAIGGHMPINVSDPQKPQIIGNLLNPTCASGDTQQQEHTGTEANTLSDVMNTQASSNVPTSQTQTVIKIQNVSSQFPFLKPGSVFSLQGTGSVPSILPISKDKKTGQMTLRRSDPKNGLFTIKKKNGKKYEEMVVSVMDNSLAPKIVKNISEIDIKRQDPDLAHLPIAPVPYSDITWSWTSETGVSTFFYPLKNAGGLLGYLEKEEKVRQKLFQDISDEEKFSCRHALLYHQAMTRDFVFSLFFFMNDVVKESVTSFLFHFDTILSTLVKKEGVLKGKYDNISRKDIPEMTSDSALCLRALKMQMEITDTHIRTRFLTRQKTLVKTFLHSSKWPKNIEGGDVLSVSNKERYVAQESESKQKTESDVRVNAEMNEQERSSIPFLDFSIPSAAGDVLKEKPSVSLSIPAKSLVVELPDVSLVEVPTKLSKDSSQKETYRGILRKLRKQEKKVRPKSPCTVEQNETMSSIVAKQAQILPNPFEILRGTADLPVESSISNEHQNSLPFPNGQTLQTDKDTTTVSNVSNDNQSYAFSNAQTTQAGKQQSTIPNVQAVKAGNQPSSILNVQTMQAANQPSTFLKGQAILSKVQTIETASQPSTILNLQADHTVDQPSAISNVQTVNQQSTLLNFHATNLPSTISNAQTLQAAYQPSTVLNAQCLQATNQPSTVSYAQTLQATQPSIISKNLTIKQEPALSSVQTLQTANQTSQDPKYVLLGDGCLIPIVEKQNLQNDETKGKKVVQMSNGTLMQVVDPSPTQTNSAKHHTSANVEPSSQESKPSICADVSVLNQLSNLVQSFVPNVPSTNEKAKSAINQLSSLENHVGAHFNQSRETSSPVSNKSPNIANPTQSLLKMPDGSLVQVVNQPNNMLQTFVSSNQTYPFLTVPGMSPVGQLQTVAQNMTNTANQTIVNATPLPGTGQSQNVVQHMLNPVHQTIVNATPLAGINQSQNVVQHMTNPANLTFVSATPLVGIDQSQNVAQLMGNHANLTFGNPTPFAGTVLPYTNVAAYVNGVGQTNQYLKMADGSFVPIVNTGQGIMTSDTNSHQVLLQTQNTQIGSSSTQLQNNSLGMVTGAQMPGSTFVLNPPPKDPLTQNEKSPSTSASSVGGKNPAKSVKRNRKLSTKRKKFSDRTLVSTLLERSRKASSQSDNFTSGQATKIPSMNDNSIVLENGIEGMEVEFRRIKQKRKQENVTRVDPDERKSKEKRKSPLKSPVIKSEVNIGNSSIASQVKVIDKTRNCAPSLEEKGLRLPENMNPGKLQEMYPVFQIKTEPIGSDGY